MAAAARPVPSTTVPVLVMRLGDEGMELMMFDAFSAGGWRSEELDIGLLEQV